MAKQKYAYQGREVDGESVEFTTQGEQWTVYNLADGSLMRVKLVMMDVARLDDEFNQNGDPIYMFSAQQVIAVTANPSLRKKAN